jgi:uncharacterized protein (TIGR00255 family)
MEVQKMKSMTGFGRGESEKNGIRIVVEMKSVNNRYLDPNIKMPRMLKFAEESVKRTIKKHLQRGRIETYINMDMDTEAFTKVSVDNTLADAYYYALEALKERFNMEEVTRLDHLLRFNDIIQVEQSQAEEELLQEVLLEATDEAVKNLSEMRGVEGNHLQADIQGYLDEVALLTNTIADRAPLVVKEYKVKLETRLVELLDQKIELDPAKIANEVAFFADRADINEEITRLNSHMKQFTDVIQKNEAVGRKLDFILQEMNRETNTIGSKSNDVGITETVIEIKSYLEKVREQVQNIE